MKDLESKLQSNIQQFRIDYGYNDVLVLCNKLTYDNIYENLDNIRYVIKECLDDGVYYLSKDEQIECKPFKLDTHFDTACVWRTWKFRFIN